VFDLQPFLTFARRIIGSIYSTIANES